VECLIVRTLAWDTPERRILGLRLLCEVEDGVRYVVTDKTVTGGETVKQSMSQTRTR